MFSHFLFKSDTKKSEYQFGENIFSPNKQSFFFFFFSSKKTCRAHAAFWKWHRSTSCGLYLAGEKMEKKSWVVTLITQLSLCFGLFLVLNIGRPQSQKPIYQKKSSDRPPLDIHFVSVRGGFRPLEEQTLLLKQVEKVVKICKAEFVVDISELGEKDPLMQNATRSFESLKVPWYTTTALDRQGSDYFLKRVKTSHGATFDLIALNTGSLQDRPSGKGRDQLHWLTRILKASNSNWCIVVGFHPMEACNTTIEQNETKQVPVSLYTIFHKHGVNAYLSGQAYARLDKGLDFTPINQRLVSHREKGTGFLLHRVSSLEMVTYFISLTGEIVHKIVLQQQGKEFM
ncbi:uncharacterized protein LOC131320316 [Rhododendron vialii]|uniref:uncharacterized protein LOC131320316 n=1 Tax=Rhododendron vialii TaxID=182163 RepID=UPI00265F89F9|nr:uncharacterized protein LOC131320316 [Rhododendron vialii]